ncbi:hypothetical protein AHAS_Ahas07G0122200 [Arachis hypogaea]
MLFGALEEARQFYYNYDNKVEFEPHIRNINFDKNGRTPINQSVQCNRDGYRTKKNPAIQSDNSLKHVFWVDARLRAAYEYFGDVVSFDTTYKLNKFEILVAAFMGVNHHRRSCLFECALLGNEDIESFEWLMQIFVKSMEKIPDGILTDQCGDMATAIQNFMPNTRHRLRIWHNMKKIPHKL